MAREYRKKLKERTKPKSIICRVCGYQKTEFRINRKKCLDCEREHGRGYRKETDKAKVWVENNRDRMSELQHQWYEKERTNILDRMKKRYQNDGDFRLAKNHRIALSPLTRTCEEKTATSEFVNCDSNRLQDWLEFQFTKQMSLGNYGRVWTLDHVLPVNTFLSGKFSSDIVLNWFNVQPLYKKSNLVKNKYIDTDQCLEHLENIREYTEIRNLKPDGNYISVLESICL